MFLLRKPIVLFAFLEMRFMCVSHDRSEEMSTPRYFAKDTDSSMICNCECDIETVNKDDEQPCAASFFK